jgi:hypothetical protein
MGETEFIDYLMNHPAPPGRWDLQCVRAIGEWTVRSHPSKREALKSSHEVGLEWAQWVCETTETLRNRAILDEVIKGGEDDVDVAEECPVVLALLARLEPLCRECAEAPGVADATHGLLVEALFDLDEFARANRPTHRPRRDDLWHEGNLLLLRVESALALAKWASPDTVADSANLAASWVTSVAHLLDNHVQFVMRQPAGFDFVFRFWDILNPHMRTPRFASWNPDNW